MSERSIQLLIGVVLIGVLIFFSKNVFNNDYITHSTIKPTASVHIVPTESPAECAGPYVDVEPGTKWVYNVTQTSQNSENQEPIIEQKTTTIQLLEKQFGSMTFNTQESDKSEGTQTTVICKATGIFGLPIVLSDQTASLIEQIQFIPGKRMYKGRSWSSELSIGSLLPIKIGDMKVNITFKVIEETVKNIEGKQYKSIRIVSSIDDQQNAPIDLGSFVKIDYQLSEGIGLTEGSMNINYPGSKGYSTKVVLKRFLHPL